MTLFVLASVLLFPPSAAAEGLVCTDRRPTVEVWDETGRTTACVSADGRWNGPAKHHRPDGTLQARGSHREGNREGRWRFFRPDGSLLRWGHYKTGRPVGDWFTLDPQGTIVATVRWAALESDVRPAVTHGDPRVSWEAPLSGAARQVEVLGDSALVEVPGALVAVSLETGERRWRTVLPEALRPGVVVGAGKLAAVTASGELVVVEPRTGRVHRIRTPLGVRDVVSVGPGLAVTREGASRVEALELETGRSLWRTKKAYEDVAPVQAGEVAVLARQSGVQARSLHDGASVWSVRTPNRVRALAVSYDGDSVFVLDSAGFLTRLAADSGEQAWRVQALGPAAVRVGVQMRSDADAVILKTGHQLVAVSLDGTPLPRVQLPKDAAYGGDRLGAEACFSTRLGELDCGAVGASPGERWRLPLSPLALAPVLLEERVLAAVASGGLLSIDSLRAGTDGGPLPEQSLVVDPAVRLVVWPATGEERGIEATAPLVEREVAAADPDCRTWQGVLDLHALNPVEDRPRVSVVEGGARPLPASDGFPDSVVLDIPGLVLHESSLDAAAIVEATHWTVLETEQDAEVRYWVDWRPTVKSLAATGGEPDVAAAVDRLLRCEGPPARFDGVAALLEDGLERQVSGRLGVSPLPHRLDGEAGCLLEIEVSGEPLGTFGVPTLPGWVEQVWTFVGLPGLDLALPPVGDAGPPGVETSGRLILDGLLPQAPSRSESTWGGPVRLVKADAGEQADLVVVGQAGTVLGQVAADNLKYGLVGEGPEGFTVPVVDWTRFLTLEGHAPVDRNQTRFLPVWEASWCAPERTEAGDRAPAQGAPAGVGLPAG